MQIILGKKIKKLFEKKVFLLSLIMSSFNKIISIYYFYNYLLNMKMKNKILLITFFLFLGAFVWIGQVNAATIYAKQTWNWSSTSTWSGWVVPSAWDYVKILVDASVNITIDTDVTVGSIELGEGWTYAKRDTLILDTDKNLVVTGNFTWYKVGIFQQNAGSSVTADNYVFGSSWAGYSMIAWNIFGTSENRASVHSSGTGNIAPAAPTLPPVQQVNWQYADFDITGYTQIALKNAWDSNAYSSLNIDHCYFDTTGYIDIGQYAPSSVPMTITNSDFRNTTSTLVGIGSNITVRNYSNSGIIGAFAFSGNTFSGDTIGKVYMYTLGNGREFKDNVFYNRSFDFAYLTGLPDEQKDVKIYNNVFYASPTAGLVNGLLVDYGWGWEIYDNLFMGQPWNTHVIMFLGWSATWPKTTIRNNVFDIDDDDADIILPNYTPIDIIENLFIGNGTPINLGLSGGGGVGSLSPNSWLVYVKNNTSYLNSASSNSPIAGLAWAGETSQHTGWDITFINNLIGDSNTENAMGYRDSQGTLDLFDYIDYTWFYNGNGWTYTKYYSGYSIPYGKNEFINMSGKIEGVTEGFWKYDQMGDPLFSHPERRMSTLDLYLGGDGIESNLIGKMMRKNENIVGETIVPGYSVSEGLQYLREWFAPGNLSLATAWSGWTYIGAISIASIPWIPTDLEVLSVGDDQLGLRWIEPVVTGGWVNSYEVQYRVGSWAWSAPYNMTYNVSWGAIHYATGSLPGLTNWENYEIQVRAGNALGYSVFWNSAFGTPLGAPDAPTIGTASWSNASATVSFTAPVNNGWSPITMYTVYSSTWAISATGTSSPITINGLTNGTSYTFTVKATNVIWQSIASWVSNTVIPSTIPNAPTIGTATGSNASATISFTAPVNNGWNPITMYTVYSSTWSISATGTNSPITVTGLTNGISYSFTVKATNLVWQSIASWVSNTVIPATIPDAPTIGTATGSNASATVSFNAPANNGWSTITMYTVYSSTWAISATGTSSPININGLTNGISYSFTVKATNAIWQSIASWASNTVIPATVPNAPTIGTATGSNASATISFTAPAINGWSTITMYTVYSSTGGISATGTSSPITINGLTNGISYSFTVKATNAIWQGIASSASNSIIPAISETVPDAPIIWTATGSNASATVSFIAPANNGWSAITMYTAYSSTGGISATGTSSPITINGLTNGISYSFTVKATNAIWQSIASSASNNVIPTSLTHSISWTINHYNGVKVLSWITINLENELWDILTTTTTNASWSYIFSWVASGGNYIIRPIKNTDNSIEVTGTDKLKIGRHIVSLETLDSIYKIISSDVNWDGSITGTDRLKLGRYIVWLDTSLLSGAWRFYDTDISPTLWNYRSVWSTRIITNLTSNLSSQDFLWTKMWDANSSW